MRLASVSFNMNGGISSTNMSIRIDFIPKRVTYTLRFHFSCFIQFPLPSFLTEKRKGKYACVKLFDFSEKLTVLTIDSFYYPCSYGREYADPYLGHGIGPVAGYGVRRRELRLRSVFLRFHLTVVPLNRAHTSTLPRYPRIGGEWSSPRYYAINNRR